jgi:hypothetical protein
MDEPRPKRQAALKYRAIQEAIQALRQTKLEIKKSKEKVPEPVPIILDDIIFDDVEEVPDIEDPMQEKMTVLAKAVYGDGPVEEFKKNHKLRSIWELSGANIQCNNTIGKVDENTKCWLCGFAIQSEPLGLVPTCDHILPIAQARFFLDLYNPSYKRTMTDTKKELLKLEYAWAHRFCNAVKQDVPIIKGYTEDGTDPKWTIDTSGIKLILDRIINYKKSTYQAEKSIIWKEINKTKPVKNKQNKQASALDSWLQRRIAEISAKAYPIIDYLQGPSIEKGSGRLIFLAGVAKSLSIENIQPTFYRILEAYDTEITKQEDAIDGLLKPRDDAAAASLLALRESRPADVEWATNLIQEISDKGETGGRTRRKIRVKK